MREQRQVSEWTLGCRSSMRLKLGCTKDLYFDLFFLHLWKMLSLSWGEGLLSEFLYVDNLALIGLTDW